MNKKLLVGVVVLLAGFAVGWFVLRGAPGESTVSPSPTPIQSGSTLSPDAATSTTETGEMTEKGGALVTATATVNYTDSGFTANTITVKPGTTVRFTNLSSRDIWVASSLHPTHQLLPGFDQLKSVAKGGIYDYAFVKVGTWKYHNHMNATDQGTVVVTQ